MRSNILGGSRLDDDIGKGKPTELEESRTSQPAMTAVKPMTIPHILREMNRELHNLAMTVVTPMIVPQKLKKRNWFMFHLNHINHQFLFHTD